MPMKIIAELGPYFTASHRYPMPDVLTTGRTTLLAGRVPHMIKKN
jgi:hypothetical protein